MEMTSLPMATADAACGICSICLVGAPARSTLTTPLRKQNTASAVSSERKVLGRPKRRKLAHAFLWEYGHKRLKLAQLLRQLGV